MTVRTLFLLPGDGIGPEAMAEVRKLIDYMNSAKNAGFTTQEGLVGGSAYDAHGVAISDADMEKALAADAILFGAVGGPKWDGVPYEHRPEAGLLRLRKDLELFANLRPAICYPALAEASSLKPELVEGLDILIVRELTGGVYFGEPKQIIDLGNGQKRGIDTQIYDTFEIERIASVAFELARTRDNRVCSMEKRNVMKSGVLWNQVVTETHAAKYKDVQLEHMLADAGGMQLVRKPKQFDVIVTDNLFGDILTDLAAAITGGIGLAASANINPDRTAPSMFEPVHGSAPDIAGQGKADPTATVLSVALLLEHLGLADEAARVEKAVADDIAERGQAERVRSTAEVGKDLAARIAG